MRYHEIFEAPLADFDIYGDRTNAGSYTASDVRAYNSNKWFAKVISHFNKVPQKINIYLYNAPNGKFTVGDEEVKSIREYANGRLNMVSKYRLEQILGIKIPRDTQSINFIMFDNEGDEKVGLTPWILAHRLVHALLFGTSVWDTRALRSLAKTEYRKLFKFKSAKNNAVVRETEYIIELFTQYIVQGKITLNIPELPFPINGNTVYNASFDDTTTLPDDEVTQFLLKAYLEQCEDEVFKYHTPSSHDYQEFLNMLYTQSFIKFKVEVDRKEFESTFWDINGAVAAYYAEKRRIASALRLAEEANKECAALLDDAVGGLYALSS